jgi:hypothetical protein
VLEAYEPSNNEVVRARKLLLAWKKRYVWTHRTMDGITYKVHEMGTDHLINCVSMYLRYRVKHPGYKPNRLHRVMTIDGVERRCSVPLDKYGWELYFRGLREFKLIVVPGEQTQQCQILPLLV